MKKKILSLMLAAMSALTVMGGLTACNGNNGKTLVVWAPEAGIPAYQKRVEEWKADHEEYKDWEVKFSSEAEGEVETKLSVDPAAGADILFFESGQIATMQKKRYFQTLTKEYTDKIKERDTATSYEPVMDDSGYAFAFPTTSDNGYFLYYDKTFFTNPKDVESLDTMLEKINTYNADQTDVKKKKSFVFEYDNGYYEVTWFMGAGCEMDWVDEDQTKYYTDVAGEKGLVGGKASMKYVTADGPFITGGTGAITAGFETGSVVAGIGGTWVAAGDDNGTLASRIASGGRTYEEVVGATKLPTFTVDDKTYQMGSFVGGKYCGVNRYKNNVESITAAMSLADYFTDERGQTLRFEASQAGPTNKNVAATDAVKSNMLLAALAEQNAAGGYTQLSQNGLWDAMAAFGKACKGIDGGSVTADNLQTKLNDLASAMAKGGTLVTTKE